MARKYNKKMSLSKTASSKIEDLEKEIGKQMSRALSNDAEKGGKYSRLMLLDYLNDLSVKKKAAAKIRREKKKLEVQYANQLISIRNLMGEHWILETLSI